MLEWRAIAYGRKIKEYLTNSLSSEGGEALSSYKRRPRHKNTQAPSVDSRLVSFFHYVNRDKWIRELGEPLTWRQRADIAGGIAVFVILIGLVVFLIVCMFVIAIEIGKQPTPNRR